MTSPVLVFIPSRTSETVARPGSVSSAERTAKAAGQQTLTTERLFVIKTRKGAFGILYENEGVDGLDRSAIADAHVDHGKVLFVTTRDGLQRGYLVKQTSGLSNQESFLMNAGRLLSEDRPRHE